MILKSYRGTYGRLRQGEQAQTMRLMLFGPVSNFYLFITNYFTIYMCKVCVVTNHTYHSTPGPEQRFTVIWAQ